MGKARESLSKTLGLPTMPTEDPRAYTLRTQCLRMRRGKVVGRREKGEQFEQRGASRSRARPQPVLGGSEPCLTQLRTGFNLFQLALMVEIEHKGLNPGHALNLAHSADRTLGLSGTPSAHWRMWQTLKPALSGSFA